MKDNIKMEPLPDYGDLMPIEEFSFNVKAGAFIDYDGHGYFATDKKMSDKGVVPSDFKKSNFHVPVWATHVMWFNR